LCSSHAHDFLFARRCLRYFNARRDIPSVDLAFQGDAYFVCWIPLPPPFKRKKSDTTSFGKKKLGRIGTQCPTCRCSMNARVRSLCLEQMAEKMKFPCSYSSQGCNVVSLYKHLSAHQQNCPYRPLREFLTQSDASRKPTSPRLLIKGWL
jgi:hypothetical protein